MLKYLGKHYGTERFFVCIFLTFTMFISAIVWGGQVKKHNNIQTLSSVAVYNNKVNWSLTGSECEVAGLYSSNDKTKVFLMLKNQGSESIDAGDYQLFMTGRDVKMENKPALTIYAFGNSGYIGFLFTDAKGFANQVLDVTIRQDNDGANTLDENLTQTVKEGDTSFYKFNQIRLYMNFGASDINYSDILNSPSVDPVKMYAEAAFSEDYGKLTTSAQMTLTTMKNSLTTVMQDRQKLEAMGLQVPNVPYYMDGDVIDTIGIMDNDAKIFTEDMLKTDESEGDATVILGLDNEIDNESEKADYSDVADKKQVFIENETEETVMYMYFLHTNFLFPGDANVDWQHNKVYDDFITQIDENATYREYSVNRDTFIEMYDTDPIYMPSEITYSEWRMANGDYFNMKSERSADQAIVASITEYEKSITNYLTGKKSYGETMNELLTLEYDIRDIEKYTTIRNCKVAEQAGYLVY